MGPDDPEVVNILQRSAVARLATLSRHGRPHLTPLYFVYRHGRIHLGTSESSLAARNVNANPRVVVLFNIERMLDDRRVLRVCGQARVRTDREAVRSYQISDVRKYILTLGGLRNMFAHPRQLWLTRHYLTGKKSCVLEINPEEAEFLNTLPRDVMPDPSS